MDHYSKIAALKKNPLFDGLTEEQFDLLAPLAKVVSLSKGDSLFKEGDFGETFFVIVEGEIEIFKKDSTTNKSIHLTNLQQGDVVGEMASMGDFHRAASALASKPSLLLEISLKKLSQIHHAREIHTLILSKFPSFLTHRIKDDNVIIIDAIKKQLEHEKARSSLGIFLIYLICLIFIYIYAIQTITLLQIKVISSTMISIPTLIVFAGFMLILIKKSHYPWSMYGFSLKHWEKYLFTSFLLTIPLIGIIIALKWIMLHINPDFFRNPELFHISSSLEPGISSHSTFLYIALPIAYAIFVPVQEIIYRGAMQTTLQHLLLTKYRTLTAILVSNLPFSLIHLHISFALTIVVYFFGVYWGLIFAKQKSLVGCTFSHLIAGFFVFYIIGIY